MPSFDAVSELDMHEVTNAVDQGNREIGNRYDFRGIDASFKTDKTAITMTAQVDFQLEQLLDILKTCLVKRGIDIQCMEVGDAGMSGKGVQQAVTLRQGIDKEMAKKMVKIVKESKIKVQAAIQGEKVRITGKKRDDLQQAMALFREAELDMPLQFDNFRD